MFLQKSSWDCQLYQGFEIYPSRKIDFFQLKKNVYINNNILIKCLDNDRGKDLDFKIF